MTQDTSVAVFLRSKCVDAAGLHFQQPVSPVGPRHTEIVDGSPDDMEGLSLQGELGGVGAQAHFPAYPPSPCWPSGRGVVVYCGTGLLFVNCPHDTHNRNFKNSCWKTPGTHLNLVARQIICINF